MLAAVSVILFVDSSEPLLVKAEDVDAVELSFPDVWSDNLGLVMDVVIEAIEGEMFDKTGMGS